MENILDIHSPTSVTVPIKTHEMSLPSPLQEKPNQVDHKI